MASSTPAPTAIYTQPTTSNSTAETAIRSAPVAANACVIAVPAAASVAVPSPGDGMDVDGLRRYRLALAAQARRYKRYPPRALETNVGGTVEVRIAVAAGGVAQEVALGRSSGSDLLDEAALDMMRKAAPRTAVPEALRLRAFVVSLPVIFDVADE